MSMYSGVSVAGGGFSNLAAGNKVYGGGRSMPTIGPVDPIGYRERDAKARARRNAMLRQLQAQQRGNFASIDALGGPSPYGH